MPYLTMDFTIWRKVSELASTCYVEIGPGPYTGDHWQDSSLFIDEIAFSAVEGLVQVHLPSYSHFAANDLPRAVGEVVIAEWLEVATRLPLLDAGAAYGALHLEEVALRWRLRDVARHQQAITSLLRQLADECERYYQRAGTLRIVGM